MLEINTSKIKNTVTFTVDKESLKEAKDAIKSVKTFAEGLEPSINLVKIKRQMKEVEAYARRMQKTMPKYNGGGTGAPSTPPAPGNRPPSNTNKPGKQTPEQKAALRAAKRNETGNMKMENFSYRASQFSRADTASLEQARKIIEQTVGLYKQEQITLQRLNQTMSHQLDSLRRSHREKVSDIEDEVRGRRRVRRELEAEAKQRIRIRERERKDKERADKRENDAKLRDRNRRYDRIKEGALGLSPRLIASSLVGAGLFAGISQLQQVLSSAGERINMVSRGAQNVQTNPNAILTMKTWGELNGVDSANIIKAIDNVKDVRERLGNSAMNATFDEKTGKWKGGDNGINDIMNQFGWNKDQIKDFQNRPLDFIQATVNEGQRRGMNSAQIGRLMENLGDDLMHYQRMFLDNGAEFMKTLEMLSKTGGTLSNEQIAAGQQYQVLAVKLNSFGEGMSNNFLTGFMDAMKGAPDFEKDVKTFMEVSKGLGQAAGDLVTGLARLAQWTINFMNKFAPADNTGIGMSYHYGSDIKPGTEGQYNNPWWPTSMQSKDAQGLTDPLGAFMPMFLTDPLLPNPYSVAGQGPSVASGMGQNAYQYPVPLQVTNTLEIPAEAFQVNIIPDGFGFSNWMKGEMDSSFSSYTRDLTLQINSGQSSTGG